MAGPMAQEQGMENAEGEQGGGGGQIGQLVTGIHKGMEILMQVMEKAGAPDQIKEGMGQVMSSFEQVVQALAGGGGGEGEQAPQKGGASPIQDSQGRPSSPAGV